MARVVVVGQALAAAAGYADDPSIAASAVETVLGFVLGSTARELAELRTLRRSGLTAEQWRLLVVGLGRLRR